MSSSSTSPTTKAQGIALDILQACPIEGVDTRLVGRQRLRRDGRLGRRRHHVGRAPQAGHEPRRPAAGQLQDHAGRSRAGDEALAERDHHRASPTRSTRCAQAVYRLSGLPRERVIGMAGVLDSARMRTFIADGAERVGRERARVRARRPWRHDGAAAALFDGRRHPAHRAAARGPHQGASATRTANGGAEITKLVGTSAWYAPGAVVGRAWSRPS